MNEVKASQDIAELASLIVYSNTYATVSGFDGETETWSDSAGYDLAGAVWEGQQSHCFELNFAEALKGRGREVSLLAVELLALALLPIGGVAGNQVELFRELAAAVPGDPIDISGAMLAGVKGPGFRNARPEDDLGQRLSWLARYVQAFGKCPEYAHVVDEGYGDDLGHEDLHERCPYDWVEESPWVSADFSSTVEEEDYGMRFDLDHMRWPDYLPPFVVRQAG
ncbi:hypothetical protein, partial [Arthrobacter sp. H5]|uniref:hypothetical protein n=1 Tax=Arthrobacter sp. H5 TaxID=1267973 RepID=UPI000489AF3A